MKNNFIKSTVLAAVLFLCGNLSAQISLEVRDPNAGNAVSTGATFYYWVDTGSTFSVDMDVFNISGAVHTYKIEKQEWLLTGTAQAWFCVFHNGDAADLQSHCYGNQTTITPDNFNTVAGDYNRIQCDFSTHTIGQSIVHYRVYDTSNPSDSVGFTMVYNATPAGIDSYNKNAGISQAFPNPSTGLFNFTIETSASVVSAGIFNLNGDLVNTQPVNVISGNLSLDLSSLPNGVYFCRFTGENMIYQERRIVIAK